MEKTKIITSHRTRVAKAEEARKNSSEKISIFDREAFVEFYLLEDILRLYERRLATGTNDMQTRAGIKAKETTLAKFQAMANIFKAAIEVAENEIKSGNYKAVWKAIPESQLMRAASSVKNLPKMKEIAIDMLKELSADMMEAVAINAELDEAVQSIDDHEKNAAALKGITLEQINEVIAAAEAIIPSTNENAKPFVSRLNKV